MAYWDAQKNTTVGNFVKLIKYSAPGWERRYSDPEELKRDLWAHICGSCERDHSLTSQSLIVDLLSTGCGCEFGVDDPDGILTPLS